MTILYLACSSSKTTSNPEVTLKAKELYCGILFNAGMDLAAKLGWDVIILSAKYGFIVPDDPITPYDQKFSKPYSGGWPAESPSYFLGGPLYFKNAPGWMEPLVPAARIGEMVNYVRSLEAGVTREAVFATHKKGKPRGIVKSIYEMLLHSRMTKEELYQALIQEHGEVPSIRKTIQAQVSQSRMGKEKRCTMNRDGDKFWITAETHFYTKEKL